MQLFDTQEPIGSPPPILSGLSLTLNSDLKFLSKRLRMSSADQMPSFSASRFSSIWRSGEP